MRIALLVFVVGCGATPTPAPHHDVSPVAVVGPPPIDAASPDAGVPDEVATAPAMVFRYHTPARSETWTLRQHGDRALMVVETATTTRRYFGPATDDGAALALALVAPGASLALTCKHETLAIGATCGARDAKPRPVLACYVPDFAAPMPFLAAPGVEYVEDGACRGYRLAPPS